MEMSVGDIVMPGDRIKDAKLTNKKQKVILGPGLRSDGEVVYACKAGILKQRLPIFYVDSFQKRYFKDKLLFMNDMLIRCFLIFIF
jgi:exosome complex RNA-binding protein Rrp4